MCCKVRILFVIPSSTIISDRTRLSKWDRWCHKLYNKVVHNDEALQNDWFMHGGEGNDGPGMLNDFGRQFTTRSGGDCWGEAAYAGIDVSGVE